MKNFILAIDQGTTGTTSLLIDSDKLVVIDKVNNEYKQHYPQPSWVEHDLNDIWNTVNFTVTEILTKNNISADQILAIGITNQRETTCAYDNQGNPLAKAIVWQDRRTQDFCLEHKAAFQKFQTITGLPLDPYFSATKMRWLLKNDQQVANAAKNNNLKLSTIDSFLLFKLSCGESFYTEPSNASRTNLMCLENASWNKELLNFFEISESFLPTIKDTFDYFGVTKGLDFLPDGIPITCLFGDQQSALFGQTCINKGDLKCTYGTGAFVLVNTGNDLIHSKNGLLTTVAYKTKDEIVFALEGSCYIAGAAVQWLRDNLGFFNNSPEIEKLALQVKDLNEMKNILFLPFFTGLGSPYWNSDAKAAIIGLTRDSNINHISRACLEGITLSILDLINAFEKDGGFNINQIRVDGGASANDLLMQIQSNYLNKKIDRPKVIETTSLGAALGALIGLGKINFSDISKLWQLNKQFSPEDDLDYYQEKAQQWTEYIKRNY